MRSIGCCRASRRSKRRNASRAGLLALALALGISPAAAAERFDGFNVIASPAHPFGDAGAKRAFAQAKRIAARGRDHPVLLAGEPRDDLSSDRHPALSSYLSIGIML
jgi:hypothetical protein